VFVFNNEFQLVDVNAAACELLKYPKEELVQLSNDKLGLLDLSPSNTNLIQELEDNGQLTLLAKVINKNELEIHSEINIRHIKENNHFIAFQRNTGSQHKVLEALRRSEYRFLQMSENIVEGMLIVEEGKVVFCNSSICKITGYTKDELKDINELNLVVESELNKVQSFLQKIDSNPFGAHTIEFWINTKHGQEKCISNSYTYSSSTSGRKSKYIITTDITARKRVEKALRKSQADFKMLAENSPDIITRYNKELKYTYANKTVEKTTGLSPGQFVGKNNIELDLDTELISFLEDMHLEVFRTGKSVKFEFRLEVGDDYKVYQAHLVPEIIADNTVESVLNVARDITQIKLVEQELEKEKERLVNQQVLLGNQLDKWCNTLCETKGEDETTECLQPIRKIAYWAQHGHLNENLTSEFFDANLFFKDYFKTIAPRIQKRNLEANLFLPAYNLSIFSDRDKLITSLNNLIDNALEATKEGKIEIGFDAYNEGEIVIFVKDTGKGMEPEIAEMAFEPFYTYEKNEHAGLGLCIAKRNTELLGGTIWALSSPETGTTLCFTHPAQVDEALLHAKDGDEKGKWRNKKVLVVEDTDENYILLASMLRKFQPQLSRAITGDEAIEAVKNNPDIDIILMDIQLPGINGYEAASQIRTFNKEVPIIAQTAYAMYDDVVKALDSGCNDFIPKPIKSKKLFNMMGKYLDA
jgi:PAS domain S-box-containing protein